MPAREGITMKLFGTALFSLAVFGLCHSGAEGSTAATTLSQPAGTSSSRSTLSSSVSTPTGPTLTTKNATTAKDFRATSTSQPTQIPKGALTTSNGTIRRIETPEPSSPSESSVTAPPNSTLSTTGQSGNTTTRSAVSNNETFSLTPNIPQTTTDSKTAITNDPGNSEHAQETPSHFSIILPIIIALIVITLSVFLLVTLYRMCWKTTPERQESGTEQAPSDKENVKLISVKTTSPETGEHSSQGKNKTRQHDDSALRLGSKRV